MALGAVPILGTRGRKSGEWHRVPVNVLEVDGRRYILAPRGDTHWARNLMVHPEAELRHRGTTERLQAIPVPEGAKQPVITAYLDKWGNPARGQFQQLPEPADHPVFRLEPLEPQAQPEQPEHP
jgi:deazaflavin-dependent oxidoreductase (nitroreductase family)